MSGDLFDRDVELRNVKKLVEEQQEHILSLLADHKSTIEERIHLRSRGFGSRQLEKQYQINLEFKELAGKVVAAVENRDAEKALVVANQLLEKIEVHEQDLIIADTSPHGWLAVAKVRSNTDLPKNIRKKLEQVERDLAARRRQPDGFFKKKFGQFLGPGREPATG